MRKIIYTLITLLFVVSCENSNSHDSEKEKFIEDLISKMTLVEKAGQMNQYNGFGMQPVRCLRVIIKRKDTTN